MAEKNYLSQPLTIASLNRGIKNLLKENNDLQKQSSTTGNPLTRVSNRQFLLARIFSVRSRCILTSIEPNAGKFKKDIISCANDVILIKGVL